MEGWLGNQEGCVMKVRAAINIDVVMGGVSHDGTGCQSYLPEGTRYEDIFRAFGSGLHLIAALSSTAMAVGE